MKIAWSNYLLPLPQIYLWGEDGGCVSVRPQDRLGIYIPSTPGAVAYDFSQSGPRVYQMTLDTPTTVLPQPGDMLRFESLPWPNRFSLAAYVTTGKEKVLFLPLVKFLNIEIMTTLVYQVAACVCFSSCNKISG